MLSLASQSDLLKYNITFSINLSISFPWLKLFQPILGDGAWEVAMSRCEWKSSTRILKILTLMAVDMHVLLSCTYLKYAHFSWQETYIFFKNDESCYMGFMFCFPFSFFFFNLLLLDTMFHFQVGLWYREKRWVRLYMCLFHDG